MKPTKDSNFSRPSLAELPLQTGSKVIYFDAMKALRNIAMQFPFEKFREMVILL